MNDSELKRLAAQTNMRLDRMTDRKTGAAIYKLSWRPGCNPPGEPLVILHHGSHRNTETVLCWYSLHSDLDQPTRRTIG